MKRLSKVPDVTVEQATEVVLNINLKTAKALGLTMLPTLRATADEVIERRQPKIE